MNARIFALGVALGSLALVPAARAQQVDELGYYGEAHGADAYASPQSFGLELRFGPYRPDIDEEFSGEAPYADTYGNDRRIMVGTEFDWQALQLERMGSLGVGAGLGYTRMKAGMMRTDGSGDRARQESSLHILPIWAVAVARLDILARRTVVPLAFYGKLGLATGLWWVKDGNGTARDDSGEVGKGRSDGFFYGGGIMLGLDAMDRSSARALDASTGVNHTYLFAEWAVLDLGTSNQMLVGDSTWSAGLMMEL